MNYLAHAFLAGSDADALLGSLLGDFWRGAPDQRWRSGVRDGVILHRKIDVYTDSHPVVENARRLFEPPWRRFAGILLDVHFDHVLARDWARWSSLPLRELSAQVEATLQANADWLPDDLNRFARYFGDSGLFGNYADRGVIGRVLGGIGRRLRHANPLGDAAAQLWARAEMLDAAFAQFFPDLIAFAADKRRAFGLPA